MGSSKKGARSAREEGLRIYGEAAHAVAREQVGLALEGEDEAIRAVSGRHVMGLVINPDGPGAGRSLPTAAVQVISNIHLPEYKMASASVSVEHPVLEAGDAAPAPDKPLKLIEPGVGVKADWVNDPEKT